MFSVVLMAIVGIGGAWYNLGEGERLTLLFMFKDKIGPFCGLIGMDKND